MARDIIDRTLRERVRRNVGRLAGPVLLPMPPRTPGRYGQMFDGGDLVAGSPSGPGELVPGLPPPSPSTPQGRILGVALSVTNNTREVAVSDPLPAPSIIRQLSISGNLSIADANSFRVLLANDSDTTATADPTGTDLIEFAGDVIGAEDPGVHQHLSAGSLVVEPWRKVLSAGYRIKVKVHNVSGGTRNLAVYIDLDDLTTL